MEQFLSIAPSVKLGEGVKLSQFINLYGCTVGDHTKIGAFVEIQKNASVGANCKISSHTFICEGVQIEDNVFIGHGVTFINDSDPGRKGRLDRVRGDHFVECRDWKECHGRSGQRGDQGRTSPERGSRQSGQSIAISKL
jgi:acyl-[acyl carrier protein]--UDP-N-acetylglucosamine O-acyltransferase